MKIYRFLTNTCVAACLTALSACTAEDVLGPLELPQETLQEGLVQKTFIAKLAEGEFGIVRENTQAAVFDGTAKRTFTVESVVDGTAVLSGTVSEDAEEYHVVYPFSAAADKILAEGGVPGIVIPAVQTVAEGDSLSVDVAASVGKVDADGNVVLSSCVSYIKIAVPQGVTSVRFHGANYEDLAGGKETIVLKPSAGMFVPGDYYMALFPTELPQGCSFMFEKGDEVALSHQTQALSLPSGQVTLAGIAEPQWISTIIKDEAALRSYFTNQDTYAGMEMKLGADIVLTLPWEPVELTGHFNGQGHTISGVDVKATAYVGFFSKVNKGAIAENFTLEGSIHAAAPTGAVRNHVGVAGLVAGGSMTGVVNKAAITTSADGRYSLQVGGIAGALTSSGKIADCENYGDITVNGTADGISVAGGIVGYVGTTSNTSDEPGGIVTGCRNHAKVISNNNKVEGLGGIAGMFRGGEIISCVNMEPAQVFSKVAASNCYVAGITGYVQNRSGRKIRITNCVNEGEVRIESGAAVGGIVGALHLWHNAGTDILSCRNSSDISFPDSDAVAYLGGIVGRFAVPGTPGTAVNTISGCSNSGNLTSARLKGGWLGGIVGNVAVSTIVSRCENYGNLSLTASESTKTVSHVGGIVGEGAGVLTLTDNVNEAGLLSLSCYADGTAAKTSEVGGIIGRSFSESTICGNVNRADITAEYKGTYVPVGGIVGCVQEDMVMDDNVNFGDVSATSLDKSTSMDSFAGGLVGQFAMGGNAENIGSVSMTGNKTFGYVSSTGRAGLLFGAAAYNSYASVLIRQSVVGGYLKGTVNSGAEVTYDEKTEITAKNFSENLWSYRKDGVTFLKIMNTTFGKAEDYM